MCQLNTPKDNHVSKQGVTHKSNVKTRAKYVDPATIACDIIINDQRHSTESVS